MKKYVLLLGLLIQAVSVFGPGDVCREVDILRSCRAFLVFGENDRDHEQLRCLSE